MPNTTSLDVTDQSANAFERPSTAARWAAGLTASALAILAIGYAILIGAFVVGGLDAIHGTWRGPAGGITLYIALVTSLVGFGIALKAWIGHERSRELYAALALFPILVAILVVGDAFIPTWFG